MQLLLGIVQSESQNWFKFQDDQLIHTKHAGINIPRARQVVMSLLYAGKWKLDRQFESFFNIPSTPTKSIALRTFFTLILPYTVYCELRWEFRLELLKVLERVDSEDWGLHLSKMSPMARSLASADSQNPTG